MYCLAIKRVLLGGHTMNKRFCINVKFNYKHLAWKLEKNPDTKYLYLSNCY